MFSSLDGCTPCGVRFTARSEESGPGGEASSPSVVIDRVTIGFPMRQAAVGPLVHARRFPATLLGCGLVELGASPAKYGFRDCLSPFRPARIAKPGQS